jgi:hypothetical protein
MKRALALLACALACAGLAACGDSGTPNDPAPEPSSAPDRAPAAGAQLEPRPLPLQAADFPALASRDCGEVASFYGEALGERAFERAALVWDDPVIDGARLEALFGAYAEPRITWGEPSIEGAAGSLYCTVTGSLVDAGGPAAAASEGTLVLRRVNDVPGATAEQLRWTIRSSTFVEPLERSGTG